MDTLLEVLILVMMFVLGAVFGSFACCQAWRWHYKIVKHKDLGQWSVCLHCKKRIKWYDNIPIVSWLVLRGKCRNCHAKIGVGDFLSEISMAIAFFMLSWAYLIPMIDNWAVLVQNPTFLAAQLGSFVMILIMLVVLMILAVYDARWGELPVVLLILAIILGLIVFVLRMCLVSMSDNGDLAHGILNALAGVAILSGTCYLIYKLSKERLMGGGDWLLALALALALADWWLALWTIFLANLLGDVIALPAAIKTKNTKVHFGPFLVAAFVIVMVLGNCLPLLLSSM